MGWGPGAWSGGLRVGDVSPTAAVPSLIPCTGLTLGESPSPGQVLSDSSLHSVLMDRTRMLVNLVLITGIKYPIKTRLRKAGLILAHSLGAQSIMAGELSDRGLRQHPRSGSRERRMLVLSLLSPSPFHSVLTLAHQTVPSPHPEWDFPPQLNLAGNKLIGTPSGGSPSSKCSQVHSGACRGL